MIFKFHKKLPKFTKKNSIDKNDRCFHIKFDSFLNKIGPNFLFKIFFFLFNGEYQDDKRNKKKNQTKQNFRFIKFFLIFILKFILNLKIASRLVRLMITRHENKMKEKKFM